MTSKSKFEGNEFAIQLMAKGSFVDNEAGDDSSFLVEAYTVRLNHVALNVWILSETMNFRECYEDGPNGDVQWEAHKAEYKARREAVNNQIIEALGIDTSTGGISITQSQSEVFTVVHIWKL